VRERVLRAPATHRFAAVLSWSTTATGDGQAVASDEATVEADIPLVSPTRRLAAWGDGEPVARAREVVTVG
jgi:hypothetical protein